MGRRSGILAGILLAWCACAAALDPSLDISQYAHTSWKIRDGFTKGVIFSIAQTPDGYLWLGTEFGLYRFDGVRATPWEPPAGQQLPSNYIRHVLAARDGTLWISTQKGLATWKDAKLTEYPAFTGHVADALLEDRQGSVWVVLSGPGRICAIRSGKAECYGAGSFGQGVYAVYEDHYGDLWALSQTGVWRWTPGAPQQYPFPRSGTEANALIEDDSGAIILATNDGLKQLAGGKIQSHPLQGIPEDIRPFRFLRSTDGSLWIGTNQGLLRLNRGKIDIFSARDGLSGDRIASILEDSEHNIWVATSDGLDRFRDLAVPRISQTQGLLNSSVNSVQATGDGSIWISTPVGLNRWQHGDVTAYRSRSALGGWQQEKQRRAGLGQATELTNSALKGSPNLLGTDDAGRLWVATADGVFYFEAGQFTRVAGVPGGNVASIAGDGHGNVWILNGNIGLFYWMHDGSVRNVAWPRAAREYFASLLPDGSANGFWLGFGDGSGIAHLVDGQLRVSYTTSDGLGAGRVNHLRFGSRGSLWVATEGGLSRIKDGQIATLTSKNGLPCDVVNWSMEDDDHAVWLYMACGLARVERSELDAWVSDRKHVVKTTVFDPLDGVRSVSVYGGYSRRVTKSPDGKIWFTTWDGVSIIDPHHLAFNNLPPPVHIEQVTADDKTYDATNGLRLPPHVRYLTIDYTALSLVAPEKVRFRYKLEGEDKDWREVVNKREVEYTNLGPKHYRFRVLACNNSGVWNEQGASLEFVIPPAWYQTRWFYALCAATFLLMLWGLYHLRVLQLQREFNAALEARVAERTRVARDIHDTLLQSFHGLLLRFQTVFQLLPERPIEAKERLGSAIDQAAEAITEGRDAVQGLRDSVVQSNDLALAISTLGEELLAESTNDRPAFRVAVEGESRDLHPIVRDEIYKVAAEALRNAFRHAQARQMEVEIRYDNKQFRLRVRDDGGGVDLKVLAGDGREGHYGMHG
ncbi:MAG TPA: two-component regulator propeller domain-containing protein, partial [Candidatus Methylomirabilis sp.]|nr:two-component regulator propeller domain-containing protein [Candidatus Methylomirabilis sp.]